MALGVEPGWTEESSVAISVGGTASLLAAGTFWAMSESVEVAGVLSLLSAISGTGCVVLVPSVVVRAASSLTWLASSGDAESGLPLVL